MEGIDMSKIIGIIMENPDLISKIRSLADNSEENTNQVSASPEAADDKSYNADTEPPPSAENKAEAADSVSTVGSAKDNSLLKRKKRNELLCALKPYVSSQRASAIDTILSVVDVFEILKARPL